MSKVTELGWKKYDAVHHWLMRRAGYPKRCDNPDCKGISKRYEWSNISGKYQRELTDWQRLCKSCHAFFDRNDMCNNGHEYTPQNTYTAPKSGIRQCKICRAEYLRRYKEKNRV